VLAATFVSCTAVAGCSLSPFDDEKQEISDNRYCVIVGDGNDCRVALPSNGPKSGDQIKAGKPLFRARVSYDWTHADHKEFSWVLDRKLESDEVAQLQAVGAKLGDGVDADLREFMNSIGAQPVLTGETGLNLRLYGITSDKVTVRDFEARILPKSCRDTKYRTLVTLSEAGGLSVGKMEFNLDEDPAAAHIYDPAGSAEPKPYPSERYESLSTSNDASVLRVHAVSSRKQTCDWMLYAKFETADEKGVVPIGDAKGKPFVIHYPQPVDTWYYDLDARLKPDGKPFALTSRNLS
jgi:hypothetical protein